ncbi:hypothetical protein SAMN05660484_02490 [Eubacterium ruminantium]|uniref:Uncharacterized protein n=1 Tax=Eubacterium ruminantium TaxID=42322 RepID=A0A1T4QJF5_9FIRM|nr:hypothetical protein [Eubacterium ruminantium]SCW68241.1 hypothetical protein SAMN05660484_02490 [Eubacterium ruminantium]SDM94765.1 hypothetical protein SAMN04490370_10810 [Eubacterium ruminantium]SKA03923.1 hypothetical protein SAMN02745110_02415 [Eubacterium ruminantium]
MKRQAGINWMCFGIFIVMLVVLIDTRLTVIPDALAYIGAGIGALLFFVGAYKYKKYKIKDKDGNVGD